MGLTLPIFTNQSGDGCSEYQWRGWSQSLDALQDFNYTFKDFNLMHCRKFQSTTSGSIEFFVLHLSWWWLKHDYNCGWQPHESSIPILELDCSIGIWSSGQPIQFGGVDCWINWPNCLTWMYCASTSMGSINPCLVTTTWIAENDGSLRASLWRCASLINRFNKPSLCNSGLRMIKNLTQPSLLSVPLIEIWIQIRIQVLSSMASEGWGRF